MTISRGLLPAALLLLALFAAACAARLDPDLATGFAAVQRNDFKAAAEAYGRALASGRLDPEETVRVLSWRAHACALTGDVAQAEADFAKAVALSPNDPELYAKRGLYRAGLNRLEDARADLARAAALAPNDPLAALYLGNVLRDLGRNDEAVAEYDRALSIAPRLTMAILGRSTAYQAMGKEKEALADLDLLAVREPDCAPCYFRRGEIMAGKGLPEAAARDFDRAIGLDPRLAQAWLARARLRLAQKNWQGAADDLDQATLRDPGLGEAYELRAAANRELNRDDQARADARRAVELGRTAATAVPVAPPVIGTREASLADGRDPVKAERELARGRELAAQGEWARAAACFSRAVELDPDRLQCYAERAKAQVNLGRRELALADYDQIIARAPAGPQAAEALAGRATLKANCGDFAGARSDLEAALAADGHNAAALAGLAWLLSVCPEPRLRDGQKAVGLAERAVELSGRRDPSALAGLAAAYAESGAFQPAARLARQAADLWSARGERTAAVEARTQLSHYERGQAYHLPPGRAMF